MKKTTMKTFINYIEYYVRTDARKVTEAEFNVLKNYYFKEKEGYTFAGDYDGFLEQIGKER